MTENRKREGASVHRNLLSLLDRSGLCVLIAAGENGRIISFNDSAGSFLGKPPEELNGVPAEEILRKYFDAGLAIDRDFVEENGVVYQVFSFRTGFAGVAETDEDVRRILRDLDDVYFKTTMDGIIITTSPSVEKFAGYPLEEVIGKPIFEFYKNPEDRERLLEELGKTGQLREYELEMLKKNGETIFARGSIHLVQDKNGKPRLIEGVLTDITERKKLEQEIRKGAEFFNQVKESVPDAVVIVNRRGVVTGWNKEAVRLFGWTVGEALGKPVDDLIRTRSGRNEIQFANVLEGQIVRGLECTRMGKDPVEKKVFVSVAPIVVDGENNGAVGIYTDLSNRESILEKLRENEVKFKSITDSAQDAVIIIDDQGCVSFFNASAERMFGYHRTETIGKKLHELIAPETYREMFETGFEEFRKTGMGIVIGRVMEMEGQRKDGTVFPVELSVSSFYMDGGWHATGILRDITDRKRIELELIEAREGALNAARTKSAFLANMSHEIRTPLNAVIGTADLLWETDLDQRQRNYLRICRNAGENLLSLINDILDISKVEAGRVELESIAFDLYENTEKTCEILALKAHEKGLELNSRILPGTPGWVKGDPGRLRQILTNLIGNAIKFTEAGEVTVTVARQPDSLIRFEIEDSGIGIPRGKLEAIFMNFTQADSSHTRLFGGSGLGLTICKKLVELMNGTISVDSELGKGTKFSFTVHLPETEPTEKEEETHSKNLLQGVRVLVVDDSFANRQILREMLEGWNMRVTIADSGENALEAARNTAFDAVVMDCMMPEMSGFDALEKLGEENLLPDAVLMMSTSDAITDCGSRKRKIRQETIVVKPVKRKELMEKLASMLNGGANRESDQSGGILRTPLENRELRVLLAEDSPDNRFLIQKYVEPFPWSLTVAENGREAVELYRESPNRFDVILMDMQMPVMDGYEATRAIRAMEAHDQGVRTPIAAITAHAMKEEIKRCMDAGCDIHISKPVRKKNLLRELTELLGAVSHRQGIPAPVGLYPGETQPVARVPVDLKPLIPGYLESRKKDILTITELTAAENFQEAGRLLHSMKGSGGGYGFHRISELGAIMEKAAINRDAAGIAEGLELLRKYLSAVRIDYVEGD